MKTRKSILITVMLAGLVILHASCEKDDTAEPQNSITQSEVKAAEEDVLAGKFFSELTYITDEALGGHPINNSGLSYPLQL